MTGVFDTGDKSDWRSDTIALLGEKLFVSAELRTREEFDRWTDRLHFAAEILWPSEDGADEDGADEDGADEDAGGERAAGEGKSAAADEVARVLGPRHVVDAAASAEKAGGGASDQGDLPALTFDAALHALRGPERRAKILEIKERGYTARQVAVAFGCTQGSVEMACTAARRERQKAAAANG